jgi:hypothetical protein
MIHVYTITYNEEVLLPFFINHYRNSFTNCKITIYDNESTDKTVEIAKNENCEVINYSTGDKLTDSKYLEIKNNCWKNSESDWVIVCDCDELIQVNYKQLIEEEKIGTNIIKPIGYSIMNYDDNLTLDQMEFGFRDVGFDKSILFNKKYINEINYGPGCHHSYPIPKKDSSIIYNKNIYKLIHYKYLYPNYTVNRHKLFANRLSSENKIRGWGYHYNSSESSIINYYEEKKKDLIKLK